MSSGTVNVPLYTSGAVFSPPNISIKSQSKTVQSAGADTTQGASSSTGLASAPRAFVDIDRELLTMLQHAVTILREAERAMQRGIMTPEEQEAARLTKEQAQAEVNRLIAAREAAYAARTPAEVSAAQAAFQESMMGEFPGQVVTRFSKSPTMPASAASPTIPTASSAAGMSSENCLNYPESHLRAECLFRQFDLSLTNGTLNEYNQMYGAQEREALILNWGVKRQEDRDNTDKKLMSELNEAEKKLEVAQKALRDGGMTPAEESATRLREADARAEIDRVTRAREDAYNAIYTRTPAEMEADSAATVLAKANAFQTRQNNYAASQQASAASPTMPAASSASPTMPASSAIGVSSENCLNYQDGHLRTECLFRQFDLSSTNGTLNQYTQMYGQQDRASLKSTLSKYELAAKTNSASAAAASPTMPAASSASPTMPAASAPRPFLDIEKELFLAIDAATNRMYAAQRTLGDTSATPEALNAARSIQEESQAEIDRLYRARTAAYAARTPAEIEAEKAAEAERVKNKEATIAADRALREAAATQQSSVAPPPIPSLAPPVTPDTSSAMPSVTADISSKPEQSSVAPPPIPSPAPPTIPSAPMPSLAPPVTPGIASGPVVTLDQVMNIIGTMSTKLDDVISRLASLQTTADATSGLLDTLSTTTTYGGGKTRRRSRR